VFPKGRSEVHEGRREERANFIFSSQVSLFAIKYVILLGNLLNVTKLENESTR
jgi:hypothetical protein